MLIADSQIHIWAADSTERPWPKVRNEPHRPVPFTKDDLIGEMDAAGVQRVVIVPPSWEGDRNDLALEAARLHPGRFAVMGRLNIERSESRGLMAAWREQTGMLGVRLTFAQPHFRPILAGGHAEWLWEEAEQAGVPLMVLIDWEQTGMIERVAERHPGLKLILDHLCIPMRTKDEDAFRGLDKVLEMARRPNIAVKATALPRYSTEDYPYRNLHPYFRRVCDAFSPKRVFWGTDLTSLPCSYSQAVEMITENMPWLSAEDKEWIMGRGLCEWLDWPIP